MADRQDALKPLRPEQATASTPDRHVWLSASAGTGKTHVLTARVFRLLLNGVPPERILCLTFTKAGAAEMANRVHDRLAAWVRMRNADLAIDLKALGEDYGPEAVARARLLFARVLEATGGGLKIQTIHSFCQTLLAAFPLEAELVPGFRALDERGQAELARETLVDVVLAAETAGDMALLDALGALSLRLGEAEAERYLMACARGGGAIARLEGDFEAMLLEQFDLPTGDVDEAIAAQCADDRFDCASLRAIARANADWGAATGLAAADAVAAWLALDEAGRAAALASIRAIVLTKDGKLKTVQKKLADAMPDYADHQARVGDLCQQIEGLRERVAYVRLAARGLHAGRAFARAYLAAKRRRGLVDFDDLIGWTIRLLQQGAMAEWIRYKLDQGVDHILVDEAQDTNRDQWAIVDALVQEYFQIDPDSGERMRTLFVVGDDKQAIFGFQGTSPDAFRAAKEDFLERALAVGQTFSLLPLVESFRSTPAVLEAVDAVLSDLGPEQLGLPPAEPLMAHASARRHPGKVIVWRPTGGTGSGEEGEDEGDPEIAGQEDWHADHVRAHATAIARQIRLWTDRDNPLWLESQGRPATAGDVMVLLRSRSDLARLIVARLFEEGVPVAGIDRLRLKAPLAVRDLLAALRFAVQPGDDLNLANLLVSPLIGWDQDRLMHAALRPPGADLWGHLRRHQPEEALRPLRDLLSAADLTTPYRLLEEILSGPMQGRQALIGRLGPEAGDAIEELVNAALAFEKDGNPSLQHFIDWFDRGEGEIKRDLGESGDAVRVLTVHGSKGLEAPIVILADAGFDPARQPRAAVVDWGLSAGGSTLPLVAPRKAERFGSIEAAVEATALADRKEHWRLLYVAMTRAEEVLAVGAALAPRAKGVAPEQSWYAQIRRSLERIGAEWQPCLPWGEQLVWAGSRDWPAAKARKREEQAARGVPDLPRWLHAPAPAEARPPRPLAPSAAVEDELPYAPPGAAERQAARRGTALHALFERLPASAPAERRRIADRWLERQAGFADAAERAALVDHALAVIERPDLADLFGPEALAEAPVSAVVNGAVVAGTIDRMLIEADRVLVVDFKTGLRVPAGPADVPASHKRQMAAYAAALAVVFPDRRIEAALLYTAGPRLISLDPADLALLKPGLDDE